MHRTRLTVAVCVFLISLLLACSSTDKPTTPVGTVPITTASEDAHQLYLQGRDLSERLQGQESIQFFEQAIALDSNFALAHLNLAFVQPSAKGFFASFDRAKALVDHVSEGEQLMILGTEAGVNGDAMRQRELYKKLVAAYPDDERAHNLLGNHYFGQQDYALAIEQYEIATGINPDFSQPYNQLGYAQRFLENYDEAEKAFKKYTQLIPDDPNPYDSYAELLMKVGKHEASVDSYRKALEVNPNFAASHVGIATNLNLLGRHEEARTQLREFFAKARDDGERRQAHTAAAVSYVDEGNFAKAVEELNKQYALAEKISDASAMSADLVLIGNVLLEAGEYDQALSKYQKALELIENSDLTDDFKALTRQNFIYNAARVSCHKKDFDAAKAKCLEYRQLAEAKRSPVQLRLCHELSGLIALNQQEYETACEELRQADQQNAYNHFRMARAYQGRGDKEKAKEYFEKAAEFNALNSFPYAFIRTKAEKQLASL